MSQPPDPPRAEDDATPATSPSASGGAPGAPPAIADGVERSLDPRSVTVERLGGLIGAGILTAILLGAATVGAIAMSLGLVRGSAFVGGALFLGVLIFARALYWPALAYRHASWTCDERGLRIRRGVLWRTEIFLPKSRVQHTDVSRGPIERSFGLAKLIMHTAGTHDASVVLGGLAEADAFTLRDYLIDVDGDDAV